MTIELDVVERGDDDGVGSAWQLKEQIRHEEGVFQQRRPFFRRAYRRSRVFRLRVAEAGRLVGYAVVRSDGYVLFLAVARAFRGRGLGRRLVEAVAAEHPSVTCHVRRTNADAIAFYRHVGFEQVRRASRYYGDGTDALYLKLDGEG